MPSLAGPPPAPGQSPPTASATTQDQTKLAKKIKERKLLISGVALLFILVSGETLRRLATEQIRAERGETDIDDATLARRARLVSGS